MCNRHDQQLVVAETEEDRKRSLYHALSLIGLAECLRMEADAHSADQGVAAAPPPTEWSDGAGIDLMDPAFNFRSPRSFNVGIGLGFQGFNDKLSVDLQVTVRRNAHGAG